MEGRVCDRKIRHRAVTDAAGEWGRVAAKHKLTGRGQHTTPRTSLQTFQQPFAPSYLHVWLLLPGLLLTLRCVGAQLRRWLHTASPPAQLPPHCVLLQPRTRACQHTGRKHGPLAVGKRRRALP